jgi:hypothetical protein
VPLFNSDIYNFPFLANGYQGIVASTNYSITVLQGMELVLIVADCTFRQIKVGDPSVVRVFNLVRSRSDPSDLYLVTMSLNVQEYQVHELNKKGPALVGMLTRVHDMQTEAVETFYMVAPTYPFQRSPGFEMYELVGVTDESYLKLRSIPKDPLKQPVKNLITARQRGFYDGDSKKNIASCTRA